MNLIHRIRFGSCEVRRLNWALAYWITFTCIWQCGCDPPQCSHLIILHWHVMVTCCSRSFLCTVTWQFPFVQETSLKRQDAKWICYIHKTFVSVKGSLNDSSCDMFVLYLFVPQFTSPVTAFIWAFDDKRKNLPFCCFVREDILEKHQDKIK